jgi:periplasmic divalent cation tolerance protein
LPEQVQLQFTAPSAEEAGRLGRLAVEGRLAACAQVAGPVTSTYWWQGALTSTTEWVCTLKTTSRLVPSLIASLRAAHPYEVPELVVTPLSGGDPDFLAWVMAETASDAAGAADPASDAGPGTAPGATSDAGPGTAPGTEL